MIHPTKRSAIVRDLEFGYSVEATAACRNADPLAVWRIAVALGYDSQRGPKPPKPTGHDAEEKARVDAKREMLQAGYDPEVVAANF